jgi:hypothetical protein
VPYVSDISLCRWFQVTIFHYPYVILKVNSIKRLKLVIKTSIVVTTTTMATIIMERRRGGGGGEEEEEGRGRRGRRRRREGRIICSYRAQDKT